MLQTYPDPGKNALLLQCSGDQGFQVHHLPCIVVHLFSKKTTNDELVSSDDAGGLVESVISSTSISGWKNCRMVLPKYDNW